MRNNLRAIVALLFIYRSPIAAVRQFFAWRAGIGDIWDLKGYIPR